MVKKPKLIIIDGYGFVFRAYHVQQKLTAPDGTPCGAIYGFTSMLLKVLNDFKDAMHAVVVFDTGGKNFRHALYPAYKAHRPPPPEDLIPQFPLIRIAARALNFPILEKDGFEADDVIASLASYAKTQDIEAVIITSDKDLMQLLDDNIKIYDPIKNKYINNEDVIKKFGVGPNKIHDILALMGDKSDNIPGIAGVGPKTALDLINKFSSFDNVFLKAHEIESDKLRTRIIESKEQALLSFKLTTLNHNIDLTHNINSFKLSSPEPSVLSEFLNKYGFKSLFKRAQNLFNIQLIDASLNIETAQNTKVEIININTILEFENLYKKAQNKGVISFYFYEKESVVHFIIALDNKCYLIKSRHNKGDQSDLFSYNSTKDEVALLPQIKILIADSSIKKITYNLKKILKFFRAYSGYDCRSFEDLELMVYAHSAGLKQEEIFEKYDESIVSESQIIQNICEIVSGFENQYQDLTKKLLQDKSLSLYKDIDLPLCYLLDAIEQEGVKIDTERLKKLSLEFTGELKILEKNIFDITGEEFNIGSPKQLGEILFNKMKLPFAKTSAKAKTFVTGAEVLEKLSKDGYKIADLLLDWRELSKLKSTYTDALPNYIDPKTARIHTSFLQTSTTTGRLSSQEPNLQNIPIRSNKGNQIRGVFIARHGYKLISADYSQIELRILSHIADITSLKDAFKRKDDIHSLTATRIFKISPDHLDKEHRRKAKAINFGIIYGISAFGLAKQLEISTSEAADYINKYFEEFPGIKEYMESTKSYALLHGYVKNILGRKCYVPGINDKNFAIRQAAERAAINAPIQGTNADIIKIAMINLDKKITKLALKSKIILQIHDELLLESPENEIEQIMPLIKNTMETAYNLSIPLIVDIKSGNNWLL